MRIVHLTWGLGIGGSETMLGDIAREHAVGHEAWIIVGNRDIDASVVSGLAPSVRVVTLGRRPGSVNPWYFLKLALWLWWINPTVVHAHQESFVRLRRLIPAPMVLTVHNTRQPLSDALITFDSVCCISEAVRDDVVLRFPECRPRIIGNGINFKTMTPKRQYAGSPFHIVQVSRLDHEQKGQDLLIRSLRIVLERLGKEGACVDFIGEGGSLDYLMRLSVECGVENQCRFLGSFSRQSVYQKLSEYDLLVQPSRYEGFGLAVVEGIAAGVPVLVSDIEGPMEIVADGQLGWSFRSEDAQDLADKLMEILELSRRTGFAARMQGHIERARDRFDISITARKYLDEYARLISHGGHAAEDSA